MIEPELERYRPHRPIQVVLDTRNGRASIRGLHGAPCRIWKAVDDVEYRSSIQIDQVTVQSWAPSRRPEILFRTDRVSRAHSNDDRLSGTRAAYGLSFAIIRRRAHRKEKPTCQMITITRGRAVKVEGPQANRSNRSTPEMMADAYGRGRAAADIGCGKSTLTGSSVICHADAGQIADADHGFEGAIVRHTSAEFGCRRRVVYVAPSRGRCRKPFIDAFPDGRWRPPSAGVQVSTIA